MPQRSAPINAGDLDRRVALLTPQFNDDADEITGWFQVAEVWAAVLPGAGLEIDEASRVVGTTAVNVIIRYRSDIDTRWRIQDREHLYEVRGKTDVERQRVQLSLACVEVI